MSDYLAAKALDRLTDQMKRFNDNLEASRINIRTHHPLCFTPPNADWSMSQIEAASRFVAHAIETGAFVLPPKGDGNVAPEAAGGEA